MKIKQTYNGTVSEDYEIYDIDPNIAQWCIDQEVTIHIGLNIRRETCELKIVLDAEQRSIDTICGNWKLDADYYPNDPDWGSAWAETDCTQICLLRKAGMRWALVQKALYPCLDVRINF